MMKHFFALTIMSVSLSGCATSSTFSVKSDPPQAEVSFIDAKSGEKKALGATPLEMPATALRAQLGEAVAPGSYFTVIVEKKGFRSESVSLPATRFGTMVTSLDLKLKESDAPNEERLAKTILERLFLAQKFAMLEQYERALIEVDKILVDFPTFPRALTMKGSIYFAQKNFVESIKWYEEALKIDTQLEDAVRMLAKVKAMQSGERVPASQLPQTPRNRGR